MNLNRLLDIVERKVYITLVDFPIEVLVDFTCHVSRHMELVEETLNQVASPLESSRRSPPK